MTAIAERRVLGLLARAEVHVFRLRRCPRQGLELRAGVTAIAERLVLGIAASAPVVRLTGFNVDSDRYTGRHRGLL